MAPRPQTGTLPALALYCGLALAATWPLALGLSRDLAWDLGDPVLNVFLIGRNDALFLRALGGDLTALGAFWDARIFDPEPRTLAWSEHLVPQSLLALPVYALSDGNAILAYNFAFLASFVLSALGMHLLLRDLTGRTTPALVGAIAFGFAAYRVEQLPHLQVLSSQWMPLALLGLRRFAVSGSWRSLAGGAAALLAEVLSCGYYALYFPPFAAAFAVGELARAGRLGDGRRWAGFCLSGAAVALLTLPFLLPYLELRASGALARPAAEIERFSADVWSWLTAPPALRLWGGLQTFPGDEGQLFPGLAVLMLAVVAVAFAARAPRGESRAARAPATARAAMLARWLGLATAAQAALLGLLLLGLGPALSSWLPLVSARSLPRAVTTLLVLTAAWLVASRRARESAARLAGSLAGSAAAFALVAALLALGPVLRARGQELGAGPYAALLALPGFDALRVPARFAMVAVLFLSLLAGLGAHALLRRSRCPQVLVALFALALLAESWAAPIPLNEAWADPALRPPPERLELGDDAPQVYRRARALPADAVLAELPFGSEPWELRAVAATLIHGKRILNGYSGGEPEGYRRLKPVLRAVTSAPGPAFEALLGAGVSHVIVHERAWGLERKGARVTGSLVERGARVLHESGGDVLVELPR